MAVTWLVGVYGVTSGCGTVMYLREGTMPDEVAALELAKSAADPVQGLNQYRVTAQLRAVAELGKTMMPLSIAQVLLSMALVAASAMMLAGRPGARPFALQALGLNGLFAIVSYALTQEVRARWIGSVVQASRTMDLPPQFEETWRSPRFWHGLAGAQLVVFELGILVLAALAVLAPRTQQFLSAVADAEDPHEREDEP